MIRRIAATAVVLALAGVACSSTNRESGSIAADRSRPGSERSADGTTAANGATSARTSAAGVDGESGGSVDGPQAGTTTGGRAVGRVTDPITLGFVRTAISNAKQFGVNLDEIQTIDEESILKALVDTYNASGGIAGRKIIPVYADTDTASNRWEADFAAACAKFTQDHKVSAVLGYVFDFQAALEDCLARKNIPHLSTTFNVPDAVTMRRYPLMFALSTPRIERRSIAKIDGAMMDGVLTKSSRFGILRDLCPWTTRSWESTVLPYVKRKGLNLVAHESFTCAGGASDNSGAIRDLQNAILRFRSMNVDRVMFHSVSEGPALLLFTHEANSQGYSPTYIMSSLANAAALKDQFPENQAANIHGYGWLPSQDVAPPDWPSTPEPAKRCIAIMKSKGISPTTPNDYSLAFSACEALFLYEVALKQTGGRDDGPLIASTVSGVGTRFVSALNLEGRSVYTRDVHDAPARLRHFAYNRGCSCFRYVGQSRDLP